MDILYSFRQAAFHWASERKRWIGYFAPGELVEPLNNEALRLKVGQYSRAIKTNIGYFILLKTEGNNYVNVVKDKWEGTERFIVQTDFSSSSKESFKVSPDSKRVAHAAKMGDK